MISYLGFPILLPNGKPFGTICVLDRKGNAYSETYENLIINFREIIQSQLELIYMKTVLGEKNKKLSDYFAEIKMLRNIFPICSFCKKTEILTDIGSKSKLTSQNNQKHKSAMGVSQNVGNFITVIYSRSLNKRMKMGFEKLAPFKPQ